MPVSLIPSGSLSRITTAWKVLKSIEKYAILDKVKKLTIKEWTKGGKL